MKKEQSRRLEGRRIIISGAASGLGRATAELFARESARVALLDRNRDGLRSVAETIGCPFFSADVTDRDQVRQAVAEAADALGGLDGLVNSAGIVAEGPLDSLPPTTWDRVISVNLTGPFNVCQHALKHLRKTPGSRIVNVASGVALVPFPNVSAYAASKGGLISLSKALAAEVGPGIRVNAVAPGSFASPMHRRDKSQEELDSAGARYVLRRVAEVREIAEAVLFLTSDASSFITGTVLAVDGGRTFH